MGNRENPELAGADVDIKAAELEQQRREVRTQPDVNFLAHIQLSQSNRVFGYDDVFESATNVFDPDIVTQRYGVEYLYPWRNRAVKAALARAKHDTERFELLWRSADNRVHRDLSNAVIGLQSAVRRINISAQNLKLADLAYQKAVQRRGARQVGYALRQLPSNSDVPWHRVIQSSGRIAFEKGSRAYNRQSKRLMMEDVVILEGRIDMQKFRWQPDLDELLWKPSAVWDRSD